MEQLYREEIITLTKDTETPGIDFDGEVFRRAAKWISDRGGFTPEMLAEAPAVDVIRETFRVLNTAISSSVSREVPPELIGALENNAFVFSGFKTYHSLSEVGLSLKGEDGGIKPFGQFLADVEKIDAKYNRNYLYAEYNHAVTSSEMAAKWQDFERDGDRYDLQYRTAGDALVRTDHQVLNGITLPTSDPFWVQFLPPNGWNCRCTVVQVRRGKYPASDSDKAVALGMQITEKPKLQMFRFNPGRELKLFPDKHPYYKAPEAAKKVIEQISDRQKRIQKMIEEMPDNLTESEKTAIASHNIELEKAFDIEKGKPMTVENADKQNANPNYGKNSGYGINCQTCAPAYMLRSRGFNITAKPNTPGSKLDYLSRGSRAWEVWKNADGTPAQHISMVSWLASKGYMKMTEKRYHEFFNEVCKEEGIYELSIAWRGGGGHATILQRFADGELRYIEPQLDNSDGSGREYYNIDYLCKVGATTRLHECRGIMRIDNKLFNTDFADIFAK